MKINKTNSIKILILAIILIFVSGNVLAFAVSSEYWEEKPVRMSPGETREIMLTLQNMPGPSDISAIGEILAGGDIAELTKKDRTYFVAFGGKTEVFIKINIPKETSIGDDYEIQLAFTTISTEQANTMGFGQSIEKKIPIVIVEEEKSTMTGNVISGGIRKTGVTILIILAAVALVLFFVLKKKNKLKKKP
ncbi:MAG: hypothetical protein ABIH59_03740 [archaeon]